MVGDVFPWVTCSHEERRLMGGRAHLTWKTSSQGMEQKLPDLFRNWCHNQVRGGGGSKKCERCGVAYVGGEDRCEGRGNKFVGA